MAAIDDFATFTPGLDSPASNEFHVGGGNDTATLAHVSRYLMCSGGGVVSVTFNGGQSDTITLTAGVQYNIRVSQIYATNTTATGIIALW